MFADVLSTIFAPMNATLENPRYGLNDPALYDLLAGGQKSEAGVSVDAYSALGLGAVWQSVATISGDVAISTLNVHIRGDDAEIDESHPAEWIIAYEANEETSAFEFWRRIVGHACLWQNGFAYIERTGGRFGTPRAAYNLLPDRTYPMRDERGDLYYLTEVDGKLEMLYREEVLHIKGFSIHNGVGYDLVDKARNCIGLALAAQGFGSKFFANGAQSVGILEIPATWTEKAAANLEEGWSKRTAGSNNWFKTAILRDGAKFHTTQVDPSKSQMQELRTEQVRDVARFFNLPPSKLGLSDSVSYNSQEQSQISYKQGCLNHWFGSIRGEAEMKLLSREERRSKRRYMEHNTTKLVETDAKSLAEILEIERRNEIINANEWRRKINLPKRKDDGGDDYLNPNTRSAASQSQAPSTERTGVTNEARAVATDAINRMARRVCFDANNAAKKPAELCQWLDSKAQVHRDTFQQAVRPSANLIASMIGGDGEALCYQWEGKFFSSIVSRIEPLTNPPHSAADLMKNVDEQCRNFTATVADEIISAI